MFRQELIEVLSDVPYSVWEKVIGKTVSEVRISSGSQGEWITAFIMSGITTYYFENLESLENKLESLIKLWKPYRDLIEKYVTEYNRVLAVKPEFIENPEITESELKARMNKVFLHVYKGTQQLVNYVEVLGLRDRIQENCCAYSKAGLSLENKIRNEAFDMLWGIVLPKLNNTDVDLKQILKNHGIDGTEKQLSGLEELVDYCSELSRLISKSEGKNDEVRKYFEKFMLQSKSIENLSNIVEDIIEESFSDCGKIEKDYCLSRGYEDVIRRYIYLFERPYNDEEREILFYKGFELGFFSSRLKMLFALLNENINVDIDVPNDMISIIKDLMPEYQRIMGVPFENCEIIENKMIDEEDNTIYVIRIPKFNISERGYNKDELLDRVKKSWNDLKFFYFVEEYFRARDKR